MKQENLQQHFWLSKLVNLFVVFLLCTTIIIAFKDRGDESETFDVIEMVQELTNEGFQFYETQAEATSLEQRRIFLYCDVNYLSAKRVSEALFACNHDDSKTPIDLYIRTEGGWEDDAFAIIDTMKAIDAPVNVHAMGGVYSAGLMIFVSATGEKTVYPNTIFGYHALPEDEEAPFAERYLELFRQNTKLGDKYLNAWNDEMHYFTPQQAKDLSLY